MNCLECKKDKMEIENNEIAECLECGFVAYKCTKCEAIAMVMDDKDVYCHKCRYSYADRIRMYQLLFFGK